ncbi:MAG: hypothetical protein SPF70_07185 [Lachnospiraceae bacterium]|nr:hypothetical protein [Lachnospiraceae bacterium]
MSDSTEKSKTTYDKQSKSFFLTLNNPLDYGYTHEHIIEIIHSKFKNVVYWCMCDEQGSCYHTHIYILLSKKKRWSAVQRAFNHSHIEQQVMGTPQDCRAYIRKDGIKYADKAETNFPDTFYEEGEIPKVYLSNDRVAMLEQIESMLDDGLRPEQIMAQSIVLRQYESLIRKHFFARRFAETPPIREVTVVWELGSSGSGKSYEYVNLCQKYGADEVFYASDYANNCTALLDNYQGEKVLFLDEVKEKSLNFGYFLQLLQGYRTPVHARYSNVYSLWEEIHITSIFTPHDIYEGMVDINNREKDSEYQLLRRITKYVYHWKTDDGEYHTYEMDAKDFISYDDIKNRAEGIASDFKSADSESTPFKE